MTDLLGYTFNGWKQELEERLRGELRNAEAHLRKPPVQAGGSGMSMKDYCLYAGLLKCISDTLHILEKTSDINIFLNSVCAKENAIEIHKMKVYALNRSEEEYYSDKSNNWTRVSRLEYWTGEYEGIKYITDKVRKAIKEMAKIQASNFAIFMGDDIDAPE
jgi:hypothetical protein